MERGASALWNSTITIVPHMYTHPHTAINLTSQPRNPPSMHRKNGRIDGGGAGGGAGRCGCAEAAGGDQGESLLPDESIDRCPSVWEAGTRDWLIDRATALDRTLIDTFAAPLSKSSILPSSPLISLPTTSFAKQSLPPELLAQAVSMLRAQANAAFARRDFAGAIGESGVRQFECAQSGAERD